MKSLITLSLVFLASCSTAKTHSKSSNAPAESAPMAQSAPAAPAKAKKASAIGAALSCTNGSDTRTLEVDSKDSGCALNYTKMGKTSAVASDISGNDHCLEVQKKIQGKLEAAGFTCQ